MPIESISCRIANRLTPSNDRLLNRKNGNPNRACQGYTGTQRFMSRLLAILAVLALTSSPVSRVICGWTCAHPEDGAAPESCHEESAAETVLSIGADHCDGTALPIALTAKLTDGLISPAPSLGAVHPELGTQLPSLVAAQPAGAASAPPASRLIPLRI